MVFVPGGGFFGGSASSVDGSVWLATAAALVSRRLGRAHTQNLPFVYVSIQYRLGVLGFPYVLNTSFTRPS